MLLVTSGAPNADSVSRAASAADDAKVGKLRSSDLTTVRSMIGGHRPRKSSKVVHDR